MAMDNELRKILLREQDLRFVTDTLTQYLGKKAEERKYYADQAHEERMAKKETETKPLEREQFYYDVAPESQWSPEFKKYVEENKINVKGGETAKLFDLTDFQSEQWQMHPEFTLRKAPSDSQTTKTQSNQWINVGDIDWATLPNLEPGDLYKTLRDKYKITHRKGPQLVKLNPTEVRELTDLLGQDIWVRTPTDNKTANFDEDIMDIYDTELATAESENNDQKVMFLKNSILPQLKNQDISKIKFDNLKTLITGEDYKVKYKELRDNLIARNRIDKKEIDRISGKYKDVVTGVLQEKKVSVGDKNNIIELQASINENLLKQVNPFAKVVTFTTKFNSNNIVETQTYKDLDGKTQTIRLTGTNQAYLKGLEGVIANNLQDEISPLFEKNQRTYSQIFKSPEKFKMYMKMARKRYDEGNFDMPIANFIDEFDFDAITELIISGQ